MRKALPRALRTVAAGGLAVAFNLALLVALDALGTAPPAPPAERVPARTTLRAARAQSPPAERPSPAPKPPAMRSALARPAPAPPQLPALRVTSLGPGPALALPARAPLQLAAERQRMAAAPREAAFSAAPPSGPLDANGVDEPPRELVGNAKPRYPATARERRQEGLVELRIEIDEAGRVREALALEVEGPDSFRQAVLRAARSWRFEPAIHDGAPVAVFAVRTIHFKLPN